MAASMGSDRIFAVLCSQSKIVVNDAPKFDLESYLQNYSGLTRLARLHFIGSHSTVFCVDALKAAVAEAKNGKNRDKYLLSQQLLAKIAPDEPEAVYDHDWTVQTTARNKAETAKLENELKQYKNNLVKESIRLGHQDLGKHFLAIGDLIKAYESFSRMRQDCTTPEQIVEVSKNLISVAMERGDWNAVQANVQKLGGTSQSAEAEKENQPYSKIIDGLARLAQRKYHEAAGYFLAVEAGQTSEAIGVISANDVAVYGAICALATMSRDELQRRVLDNSTFRSYLELEPQLRRAITFFVNCRYSNCLLILETYRCDYLLDVYLSEHVSDLFQLIRTKSIVEYFVPFSKVTLDTLNEQFATPGNSIEEELISLIKNGQLEARIDTQNKLLVAVPKNPRAELHSQTLAMAAAYEREVRRRIMRMNIIGADLEVKGPKKNQGVQYILPSLNDSIQTQRTHYAAATPDVFDNDSGYE